MRADIEQVRQNKLAKFCQVLLVDYQGKAIESCNSIFDIKSHQDQPVDLWFPFIESIFPSILELSVDSPELLFTKVEGPASFLPGFYDFTFSKAILDNKEFILWEIYDFTSLYEDFRLYQQKRNELEIQRQVLAIQNKRLRSKKDVHNRENLIFDSNKKLNTPISNFDTTLNAIGSFVTNNRKGDDLLNSLDNLSFQLKEIINELPPQSQEDFNFSSQPNNYSFSLENVLYDAVMFITEKNKEINIIEASVAEEIPTVLGGDELDLKRIIVGLATNISKLYSNVVLKLHLYLHDRKNDKCIIGIQVKAIQGENLDKPVTETLLRIAVVKKIVELHEGRLELESSGVFGSKIKCYIPYNIV